jgi:hypothetical protein
MQARSRLSPSFNDPSFPHHRSSVVGRGFSVRGTETEAAECEAISDSFRSSHLSAPRGMRRDCSTRHCVCPLVRLGPYSEFIAGDLRESVGLSSASWCAMQRAPLGK